MIRRMRISRCSTRPRVEGSSLKHPKTAYVLLWYPKPSETFIFHEVSRLKEMGLPLRVFTLYGELKRDLSPAMLGTSNHVERLGILHGSS